MLPAVLTKVVIVFLRPSCQMLVEYRDPTTTAFFRNLSDSVVGSQITVEFVAILKPHNNFLMVCELPK